MKSILTKSSFFFLVLLPLLAFSPKQDTTAVKNEEFKKIKITERDYNNMEIEMADIWYTNGKIYVVIATVASILAGIFFYLIALDKKVKKLEKQVEDQE